jgi:hypothetical protein
MRVKVRRSISSGEVLLQKYVCDVLPNLADWQRKNMVSDLDFKGAIRMAKRTGVPFDYTVVLVNYNHPVVREMC